MFSSIASSAKGSQNKEIKIPVGNSASNFYNYQQTFQQQQQQLQQPQQTQPIQQSNQRKPSISSITRPQKFSISIQNKDQPLQQEILSDDRNYTYHKKKTSYQQAISSNQQGGIQNPKKNKQSINLNNLQNLNLVNSSTNANSNHILKSQLSQQNVPSSTFSNQNTKNQFQQSQQQFSSATLNSHNKNSAKDYINYKILQIQANSSKNQSISSVQQNGNLQAQNQISQQLNNAQTNNFQTKSNQLMQNHGSGNSNQQLVIASARRNESSSVNVRQRGNEQIKIQNNRQDQSDLKDQPINQYEDILKEKQNIIQNQQNTVNQIQSKILPQQQVMINNYTYQNNQKNVSNHQSHSQNVNSYNQVSNIENNINSANQQPIQERPKINSQQQHITNHINHKSINIQQSQAYNYNQNNIENNTNNVNLHLLQEKNKFNTQQQHFNSNTLNSYSFLSNNNNISSTSNFSSFGTLPKGTSANILKQQQQAQQQQSTQSTLNSMLLHLQQNDLQKNYFLNQQKIQNSTNNNQQQYAYQRNNQLEINSASNLALTDQEALKELLSKTTSTKSAIKNAANYFSSHQHKQQILNTNNIQQEEKPGFQSERLNNSNNTQFILQNQVAQKKNENTNNSNKSNVQSHLKVQQQQKIQNNSINPHAVEQIYQNQAPIQKKIQEKIQKFTQIQTQIQNQNQIQTSSLSQNSSKSHLKANPIAALNQANSYGIINNTNSSSNNTNKPTPAIASVSSVSSTQNLHLQKTNETLSNFTVSPIVPNSQVQFPNQVGLLSANSNNSMNNNNINNNYYSNLNNKAEYPYSQNNQTGVNNISQIGQQSGQCCSNNNNTTQNSAINQNNNKNLLSTAIKSETTQFSNFSQDSPLVCNENLSGILTNRYGDNSQFKNLLSCKSNNMSSNNINPGTYNSNTSNNIHQNSSSFTQTLSENKEKIQNNIQIQNYLSSQHQTSQINSKIGITNIQSIEEYNTSAPYVQSQALNNYGVQNISSNNNNQSSSNNISSNNNNCGFKPTHKKNLSNHLINKLGAICKSATEGSQTYTQSSQNNSQNKDSFNNNTLSSNQNKTKNNTVSISLNNNNTNNQQSNTISQVQEIDIKKEDTVTNYELEIAEENLKDSIEQFNPLQNQQISKQILNNVKQERQKNKEQRESIEQQLLNFQHQNILSENIEYRIKDMKEQEIDYLPNPDYFDNQTEITCMMRCILFDWMFDVCMGLMLKRETLYLSLNYVDRYLSSQHVTKLNLQLVGAVSLYMACKIEEIHPPSINEFAKCTDDGYTVPQIVEYELLMLKAFDWKLNPPTQVTWLNIYTEIWDRFIKSSFDKPSKYQINFVQDQKITNKNYLILYRIPEQKSYMLFRQMTQILDLMQLDANVLRFESRMLIASLMYLQLGIYYKQFTKKQVHSGFNEKYLFANSLNNFNEYFNSFLTQHFQFNLIDILSTLQYVASFFDVEYNYSLSPAAQIIDPKNNEMSYEEYLSFQTYFPNGIDYMRKRYCS